MTEPNRDATNPTNPNPASGSPEPPSPCAPVPPASGSPVPPASPSDVPRPLRRSLRAPAPASSPLVLACPLSSSSPVHPDPSIPHPGVFGERSCRVPGFPPQHYPRPGLWEAVRYIADLHLGVRWVLDVAQHERAATLRKVDEDLRFELSFDLARHDAPYATLVRHRVDDPLLAERLRSFLRTNLFYPGNTTGLPLRVGYGHDTDPCDPDAVYNFELSVLNLWNPPPYNSQLHAIGRFLVWNVDVLLWLRAQAAALPR